MIITECNYCNHPIITPKVDGRSGHFPEKCEECGEIVWIENASFGGQTLSSEYFLDNIVREEDKNEVKQVIENMKP